MRMNIGKVTATSGLMARFSSMSGMNKLASMLTKYEGCDWGLTDKDDWVMNDQAVESKNGRVVALYKIDGEEIFIITEYTPKPLTTVMLTGEY